MARKRKDGDWPFVEVLWHDATSESAWCDHDGELPETAKIMTRGWLVRKTARGLTLAASRDLQEARKQIGEIITIPRGCVEKITELVL